MSEPTYGLIGRGRVAIHMARYLELEAQSLVAWHRDAPSSAQAALADADVILVAISDDSLRSFLAAHAELEDRPLVHFSGSLAIDGAHGLHPLMTFGPELYDLDTYRSIPFIEERGGVGFRDIFPALRNPSWAIDPEQKPLYHALCVLAGNFTTLLWSKAIADFEGKLELPREALVPFLARTCSNTAYAGRDALTGPLARGDAKTAARDLRALDGDPYEGVYRAFAALFGLEEFTA
jgi:predicted short-subunit dehydrogenase-like oxidoreductase (DUF2520 family)